MKRISVVVLFFVMWAGQLPAQTPKTTICNKIVAGGLIGSAAGAAYGAILEKKDLLQNGPAKGALYFGLLGATLGQVACEREALYKQPEFPEQPPQLPRIQGSVAVLRINGWYNLKPILEHLLLQNGFEVKTANADYYLEVEILQGARRYEYGSGIVVGTLVGSKSIEGADALVLVRVLKGDRIMGSVAAPGWAAQTTSYWDGSTYSSYRYKNLEVAAAINALSRAVAALAKARR